VRDLIAGGLTVVLVSHDARRPAGFAGQVLVLRGGRLAEQGPVHDIGYLKERA